MQHPCGPDYRIDSPAAHPAKRKSVMRYASQRFFYKFQIVPPPIVLAEGGRYGGISMGGQSSGLNGYMDEPF